MQGDPNTMYAVNVLPIGTPVRIGEDVPAVITEISLRAGDSIQYQCAWWAGPERKTGWLSQHEVSIDGDARPELIGFRLPSDPR